MLNCPSELLVILHFHQQCCNSSCFFTSCCAFSIASNLYFDHLDRCVTVFHDCFNLYFPDDIWDVEHFFICFICHLYAFWWDFVQDFCPLFSMAFFFFFKSLKFLTVLIHFGYQSFNRWVFFSNVFPVRGLSSNCLHTVLQKVLFLV